MKILDQLTAFTPDAQIWMIPDLENSAWTKKIDWYLNYQIQRSLPHRPASFSKDLADVIEKSEFDAPTLRLDPESPLMIACETLLPAKQAIVVPLKASEADWVSTCHRVWVGMGRPSVRIFLPKRITTQSFAKLWPKQDLDGSVEVLADDKSTEG
ncbi:MAG: hypothetical protein V4692_14505 [Bdellovibrionota bacterium]